MSIVGKRMNGLSLHQWTLATDNWVHKGSATDFDEAAWMASLSHTLRMDEFVTKNAAIMDKYDPQKKVGLLVDEWGDWHDTTPGARTRDSSSSRNTMRDAVVAALNLHIFQKHADRVTMSNIAQMINVLQAMWIFTDGPRMVLTPTYHVFEMFKVHQGATSIPVELVTPDYVNGEVHIPEVSASASRDQNGLVHITLVNADPNHPVSLQCKIVGADAKMVTGRVLTAPTMQAHNTFESPDAVKPVAFRDFSMSGGTLSVTMPSKAVAVLELTL